MLVPETPNKEQEGPEEILESQAKTLKRSADEGCGSNGNSGSSGFKHRQDSSNAPDIDESPVKVQRGGKRRKQLIQDSSDEDAQEEGEARAPVCTRESGPHQSDREMSGGSGKGKGEAKDSGEHMQC